MSERANSRGGRGGAGSRGRGGRGGAGRDGGPHNKDQAEKPKKENILDLNKYIDKEVNVKFSGGREVIGVLKGFDPLMNLVLDNTRELLRDDEGNESTRSLGLLVARGTLLVLVSPQEGSEQIDNPFTVPDQ